MITRRVTRPLSAFASSSAPWTCPSCARASLLQQKYAPKLQRRRKHNVATLDYTDTFMSEGIPGLMSAAGFRIAWKDYETSESKGYQETIIDKLNELTAGEETYNDRPKTILLKYARDPMNASLFNHASMAFNNEFFFNGLSSSPLPLSSPRMDNIKRSLEKTFGTIDTLRTAMLDTAAAMFGPGFVWLVWTGKEDTSSAAISPDWRILTTYNAGTPFPEAGHRHQGIDMNTSNAATFSAYQNAEPVNAPAAFGPQSAGGKAAAQIPVGGTSLVPVLCVNTWEHVWLYDFGIQGKRRFLADWWDAIDWFKVEAHTPRRAKERTGFAGV